MADKIRVTVWNEGYHEQHKEPVKKLYPKGIHGAIADFLKPNDDMDVRTATLFDADQGLPPQVLDTTDVLLWWAHVKHNDVSDELAERVHTRVLQGMGLIVLHSAHMSKPFRRVIGTSGTLRWREAGERERLWNIEPGHPITQGIGEYFELEHTEMYGERFDIPTPDEVIFISWFEGGDVFRSGCTFRRGHGKVFSFRPGHETYPIFYDKNVQTVITNAVRWARPQIITAPLTCKRVEPLEPIKGR